MKVEKSFKRFRSIDRAETFEKGSWMSQAIKGRARETFEKPSRVYRYGKKPQEEG